MAKPMRILFVNAIGQIGGAERVLLDLSELLPSQAPEIERHLLLLEDGPLAERARKVGVQVHIVPLPRSLASAGESGRSPLRNIARTLVSAPSVIGYRRRLRKSLAQIAPTIVHCNGIKPSLLVGLAAAKRIAILWHIHDFIGRRRLVAWILRRMSRSVTAVAVSKAVADDFSRAIPGVAVHVVHNGVNLEHFSPGPGEPDALDELARVPRATVPLVRVGLVATYARWKGHTMFLKAIAKLPRDLPARFYIVGGPIYSTTGSQFSREELTRLARDLRIEERLGFVDFQPDPVAVYRALDIIVNASTSQEPFGLTIAEAIACGRRVIATAGAGVSELFPNSRMIRSVDPLNADTLAGALMSMIHAVPDSGDNALASRVGERESLDRRVFVRRFVEIYRSLGVRRVFA